MASSGRGAVDAVEEVEECGVDLGETLLLCPVAANRQRHRAVRLRRDSAQRVVRPAPATANLAQRAAPVRGCNQVIMSRSPATLSAGTSIPRPRKGASSSLLRSMFRYQSKASVTARSPCRLGDSLLLEADLVDALAVLGAGDRGRHRAAGQNGRNIEPGHRTEPCPGAAWPLSRQRVHPSRGPRRPPAPPRVPRSGCSRRRRGGAGCTT